MNERASGATHRSSSADNAGHRPGRYVHLGPGYADLRHLTGPQYRAFVVVLGAAEYSAALPRAEGATPRVRLSTATDSERPWYLRINGVVARALVDKGLIVTRLVNIYGDVYERRADVEPAVARTALEHTPALRAEVAEMVAALRATQAASDEAHAASGRNDVEGGQP